MVSKSIQNKIKLHVRTLTNEDTNGMDLTKMFFI